MKPSWKYFESYIYIYIYISLLFIDFDIAEIKDCNPFRIAEKKLKFFLL